LKPLIFGFVVLLAALALLALFFRAYRPAGAVGLLVVGVWVGALLWEGAGYRSAFLEIEQGTSESVVLTLMGTPDRITDGTLSVYGGPRSETQLIEGCRKEFWYVAALSPEQWSICIDAKGVVVEAYHHASY